MNRLYNYSSTGDAKDFGDLIQKGLCGGGAVCSIKTRGVCIWRYITHLIKYHSIYYNINTRKCSRFW